MEGKNVFRLRMLSEEGRESRVRKIWRSGLENCQQKDSSWLLQEPRERLLPAKRTKKGNKKENII